MSVRIAQDMLFNKIREFIPPEASVADVVAELLNLSPDSAYRRIRGDTPLVLDEAKVLCTHFKISLDQLYYIEPESVLFRNVRIDNQQYTFEHYISGIRDRLRSIRQHQEKDILYLTKDLPLVHNFYFPGLTAFRYYFWMKNILQHPDFSTRSYDPELAGPLIRELCQDLTREYTQIPSTEIWNAECINSAISQVEFCKSSGYFNSSSEIRDLYGYLEETILHVQAQCEAGRKFMPGDSSPSGSFRFFYNRVILGDNTILVNLEGKKSVYLNYDALNYLTTGDITFCEQCESDLRQLIRKSTLISQTGEKQRNIFFGILLTKIKDRLKHL
ncbi:MAG: hypothetical protein ACO25B_13580 [Chitinophagaceae bacterium]